MPILEDARGSQVGKMQKVFAPTCERKRKTLLVRLVQPVQLRQATPLNHPRTSQALTAAPSQALPRAPVLPSKSWDLCI